MWSVPGSAMRAFSSVAADHGLQPGDGRVLESAETAHNRKDGRIEITRSIQRVRGGGQ